MQLRLQPGLLLYKALNYFVLKTNKQKSDFQPARIFNCFLITYERTMGIGLCKYLNRFSMMPDFHSAINVFILLLLSYGFNFHSENVPSAEKTKEKSRCMAFSPVSSGEGRGTAPPRFLRRTVGGSSEQEAQQKAATH